MSNVRKVVPSPVTFTYVEGEKLETDVGIYIQGDSGSSIILKSIDQLWAVIFNLAY